MRFDQGTLSILAVAGLALAGIAALLAVTMASRVAFLNRAVSRRRGGGMGGDVADAMDRQASAAGELAEEVRIMRADLQYLAEAIQKSIQRVGLVRFDAFDDMGGRLSFSAALLDASGDGLVLSTINGRSESRIYAKPIERGASRYNLSAEEQEAVRRALATPGR